MYYGEMVFVRQSVEGHCNAMKLTLEITVSTPEAYLQLLHELGRMELNVEYRAQPSLSSLGLLAEHEANATNDRYALESSRSSDIV